MKELSKKLKDIEAKDLKHIDKDALKKSIKEKINSKTVEK